MTASGGESEGVEGLSKKEKGPMDVDNSVGRRDIWGLNGNGKNTIKNFKSDY